ncbi:short chain dehydrogenase [Aspergillus pseudoustus]|uniref:Short chain dehydrogenase n=1 Tax=Aspergillus pseudoustus TaxID=1810923 RepID=A0ABR4K0L2_9EURO
MPFPAPAIYPSLRDKTVVISGGTNGIGAATVTLFALQGSQVIFLDISKEAAEQTVEQVISHTRDSEQQPWGPPVKPRIFYHCDLTDLSALQSTAARILDEHGPIHVLVNNAAATSSSARMPTETVTPSDWDFSVNANLRHVFFLSQAFIPAMKHAGGGSIVNLGSISWRIPAADGQAVYAACKAAIMGLTRVQSKEVGDANIRINSVMPGAIATQRQREEVLTPEYRAEVFAAQSLKRDLVPEDVAKVIVFLGSEEASGVTGSTYVVDGGWVSDP